MGDVKVMSDNLSMNIKIAKESLQKIQLLERETQKLIQQETTLDNMRLLKNRTNRKRLLLVTIIVFFFSIYGKVLAFFKGVIIVLFGYSYNDLSINYYWNSLMGSRSSVSLDEFINGVPRALGDFIIHIIGFFILYSFPIGLCILVFLYCSLLIDKKQRKVTQINLGKVKNEQLMLQHKLDDLIPAHYQNLKMIYEFENYAAERKARNLEECITLYNERRSQERNRNLEIDNQDSETKYDEYNKQIDEKETTSSKEELTYEKHQILNKALTQLNEMIGLEEVKNEVNNFMQELEGRKITSKYGKIKSSRPNLNMMFLGPPGTGKTEVARILAKILYGIGFSRTSNFVEASRDTIIGKYIGHTEANMDQLIKASLGGVLFIDEAYALASTGDSNDFGKEAINVLIKAMEDKREDLVVILAGYRAEMQYLLNMNEGFQSRIAYTFEFPDYTTEELAELGVMMLQNQGFNCFGLEEEIEKGILKNSRQGTVSGNARWVRQFIEKVIKHYHVRVVTESNVENIGYIRLSDINMALGLNNKEQANDQRNEKLKEEALNELQALIGLGSLKDEIERMLKFLIVEQRRLEQGLTAEKMGMHMIFLGSPGTGKTTVARIIGKFLKGTGVLSNGRFWEVSRSDLVAEYIGQTASKVKKVVEKAKGGILFIDEAYSLARSHSQSDFGAEAIDTLIKRNGRSS